MLIMLRLRQQGALLKMGKTVTLVAGEAENDNDQVPKVPIIVKEPAGDAPEQTEEPQAPEVPETADGSSCASTPLIITSPFPA